MSQMAHASAPFAGAHFVSLRAVKAAVRRSGFVGLAVSVGLLAAACTPARGETAAAAPPPPDVRVAAPAVGAVDVYGEVIGRFEAVQTIEVRAQVSGRLTVIHFRDGQDVQAGDPLFTIDPAPFAAAADLAEAEEERALTHLALARDEARRSEALVNRNVISQEEHDRRMHAAEGAEAAVRGAHARLETARIDLGYTVIATPINGRVSDRRIDAGNLITAGDTLLTTLVSQGPIHVTFAVSPDVAAALGRPNAETSVARSQGVPVQIKLEGEAEFTHAGRVDFVDNYVSPRSGVVRMRAVLDNPDGQFTPGQFARVRFTKVRIDNALLVPEAAVFSDQNFKYVLVVTAENTVDHRAIVAGPLVNGMRVVESGLAREDHVIVGGSQRAYPGQQVTPTLEPIELAAR